MEDYKRFKEVIEERLQEFESEIVTIRYPIILQRKHETGYLDFFEHRQWYLFGTEVECQVQINPETKKIEKVLSAKKIEYKDTMYINYGPEGKDTLHEIVKTEDMDLSEVDVELLQSNIKEFIQ